MGQRFSQARQRYSFSAPMDRVASSSSLSGAALTVPSSSRASAMSATP